MKAEYTHGSDIARLLNADTTDKVMYGFVEGVRAAMPDVSVWEALNLFEEVFNIESDSWNRSSAQAIYYRHKSTQRNG